MNKNLGKGKYKLEVRFLCKCWPRRDNCSAKQGHVRGDM